LLAKLRRLIGSKLGNLALDVRRENAERILNRRLSGFGKKDIFKGEDISAHFGDEELSDVGLQKVVMSFIIGRVNFIEKVLTKDEIATGTFVDLGDSSGIFLKALGKRGTSVNIAEEPLKNIRTKGIKVVKADINDRLPFEDGSIDHILMFETLEHLPNPIAVLKEIYRICRKSAFVSVPYVSRTNIHSYNYCPGRPIHEHHIFEFSDSDFRKIVTHAGFKIDKAEVVEVLDNGRNPKEFLIFSSGGCAVEGTYFGDALRSLPSTILSRMFGNDSRF
jgi:SAM-dependent methyltransferase